MLRRRATGISDCGLAEGLRSLVAGIAISLISIPQGIAYALVAGLPPVMGLYSAAVPAIVGSLTRSSRFVVTGPTNALSLLIGSIVAANMGEISSVVVVATLTTVVGVVQWVAGGLRLGAIVDFVSAPVVFGYITGAAVLIAVGQLGNATGLQMGQGHVLSQLEGWFLSLADFHLPSVMIAVATVITIVFMRRIDRRIPGSFLVMALGILASAWFDLTGSGMRTIASVAPISPGLPLQLPMLEIVPQFLPGLFALVVLSLMESTTVARSFAMRSGETLDANREFRGQGLANLCSGLFGGFTTSGSLTRSELNFQISGGRVAGVFSGIFVIVVIVVLGPLFDLTPIPVLAGLLMVIAVDLINPTRIFSALRTSRNDALAFLTTLFSTWIFPIELAVLLGAGVSLALFLRQVRMLRITEFVVGHDGGFIEIALDKEHPARLPGIRILNMEGPLFFGAAAEMANLLDVVVQDGAISVVIRVKRTQGLDATVAEVLRELADRLQNKGGSLVLTGLHPEVFAALERSGVAAMIGPAAMLKPGLNALAALAEGSCLAASRLAFDGQHPGIEMLQRLRMQEANPSRQNG